MKHYSKLLFVFFFSLFTILCSAQDPVFYGMIRNGGGFGLGAIIRFNPSNNMEDTVYSFRYGDDGVFPYGSLVYYPGNGLFYGMTWEGGSNNLGTIIRFNPITNAEDTVHSFGRGFDGSSPIGDLVYYPGNGLFYAMTNEGGSRNGGAIISFNPTTNVEDTVHSFGAGADGQNPSDNLVYYPSNGLFYGMTSSGGKLNEGAIISFNPITNMEDTVYSFGYKLDDGQAPSSNLVYYPGNGLFYGMTFRGGTLGIGTIISFNPTTNMEDTVHSFGRGDDGRYPSSDLVYYSGNGLFYGVTYDGGNLNLGAIISFNPITNMEDTIHSFGHGTDGIHPTGNLVYYSGNGLFYGMTQDGGSTDYGTIITFNPINNTEDTVHSFGRGDDGQIPSGGALVLYNPAWAGIDQLKEDVDAVNIYPNPGNGQFTIALSHPELARPAMPFGRVSESQTTIEIYNVLGEKVYNGMLKLVQHDEAINLSAQPNGVYLYRVLKEDGELIGSGKLIIAK